MYEFWYDYVKLKNQDNAKLCYMNTDSFIIHIKTEEFCKDIANNVQNCFDTSNYDEDEKRPLPIGKNKKVIGLFKDELGGKIMIEFVGLGAKMYACLMDDDSEKKKAKETKKCVIKRGIRFESFKDCSSNNKTILKLQQRFKSDYHTVYTERINEIASNINDDKRLQKFDKITIYSY